MRLLQLLVGVVLLLQVDAQSSCSADLTAMYTDAIYNVYSIPGSQLDCLLSRTASPFLIPFEILFDKLCTPRPGFPSLQSTGADQNTVCVHDQICNLYSDRVTRKSLEIVHIGVAKIMTKGLASVMSNSSGAGNYGGESGGSQYNPWYGSCAAGSDTLPLYPNIFTPPPSASSPDLRQMYLKLMFSKGATLDFEHLPPMLEHFLGQFAEEYVRHFIEANLDPDNLTPTALFDMCSSHASLVFGAISNCFPSGSPEDQAFTALRSMCGPTCFDGLAGISVFGRSDEAKCPLSRSAPNTTFAQKCESCCPRNAFSSLFALPESCTPSLATLWGIDWSEIEAATWGSSDSGSASMDSSSDPNTNSGPTTMYEAPMSCDITEALQQLVACSVGDTCFNLGATELNNFESMLQSDTNPCPGLREITNGTLGAKSSCCPASVHKFYSDIDMAGGLGNSACDASSSSGSPYQELLAMCGVTRPTSTPCAPSTTPLLTSPTSTCAANTTVVLEVVVGGNLTADIIQLVQTAGFNESELSHAFVYAVTKIALANVTAPDPRCSIIYPTTMRDASEASMEASNLRHSFARPNLRSKVRGLGKVSNVQTVTDVAKSVTGRRLLQSNVTGSNNMTNGTNGWFDYSTCFRTIPFPTNLNLTSLAEDMQALLPKPSGALKHIAHALNMSVPGSRPFVLDVTGLYSNRVVITALLHFSSPSAAAAFDPTSVNANLLAVAGLTVLNSTVLGSYSPKKPLPFMDSAAQFFVNDFGDNHTAAMNFLGLPTANKTNYAFGSLKACPMPGFGMDPLEDIVSLPQYAVIDLSSSVPNKNSTISSCSLTFRLDSPIDEIFLTIRSFEGIKITGSAQPAIYLKKSAPPQPSDYTATAANTLYFQPNVSMPFSGDNFFVTVVLTRGMVEANPDGVIFAYSPVRQLVRGFLFDAAALFPMPKLMAFRLPNTNTPSTTVTVTGSLGVLDVLWGDPIRGNATSDLGIMTHKTNSGIMFKYNQTITQNNVIFVIDKSWSGMELEGGNDVYQPDFNVTRELWTMQEPLSLPGSPFVVNIIVS